MTGYGTEQERIDDRRELITHIKRFRAVAKATSDVVHKSVLFDIVRYLETKLAQMVGREL